MRKPATILPLEPPLPAPRRKRSGRTPRTQALAAILPPWNSAHLEGTYAMSRTAGFSFLCLIAGLIGGAWYADRGDQWQSLPTAAAQTAPTVATSNVAPSRQAAPLPSDLTPDELRNISVYETANRSVVNIDTTRPSSGNGLFMPQREAEGSGSGAVLDRDGHIITNYHVIDGAAAKSR